MTARITCGENAYSAAEGETVLDCLSPLEGNTR